MKQFFRLSLACAFVVMMPALIAEDDDNKLIVTAQYRETTLIDTASSISLLSEDVLQDAGEQHLEEVLNLVANLNWAGGSSRPRYFQIRGIGERSQYEGAPDPSVGIVIDDIDFSGIGMVATLFDTQQIEVLRGPQSARYGANAIAGLINITTRAPQQDFHVYSQLMSAEDDNWSTAISVTGALDTQQSVTGLFSLQQFQANGFVNNSYLNKDDSNNKDEFTSRAKLHWQIDDKWHLALTGLFVDMDNGYDAWAIDNSMTSLSDKPGKDSQSSVAGAAKFTMEAEHFLFVSISTKTDSDIEHSYDGDWGNEISWGANGPYDFTSENLRHRKTWSQEFRLISTPKGALNNTKTDWLVGLYLLDLDEDNEILELYNGNPWREINSTYNAVNTALFAELTQHINASTDVIFGLRFEQRDASYSDSTSASFTPEDQMLGGNLILKHYLQSGLMTWAGISRGYKAGGFNISLSVREPSREYQPEFLWNYEVGIKGWFLDQKLFIASSVFNMDRKNMQIDSSTQLDPQDPLTFFFFTDNAAETYNRGFETELQYQLSSDWKIETSLGILDTKIESYDGVDQTLTGRKQAHAPAYNYSIATEYRDQKGWFGRLDISGKDDFYYSNSHQQQSEAHQLINIKAGYETEFWSVYFWGRNITDEVYHVRGFFFANEPPDWQDKLYTQQGNPRQFGITGRLMF